MKLDVDVREIKPKLMSSGKLSRLCASGERARDRAVERGQRRCREESSMYRRILIRSLHEQERSKATELKRKNFDTSFHLFFYAFYIKFGHSKDGVQNFYLQRTEDEFPNIENFELKFDYPRPRRNSENVRLKKLLVMQRNFDISKSRGPALNSSCPGL